MVKPRIVPRRDEKYMGLAFFISSFSKDPNTQVGAIIVGDDNRPLGTGYNGPPSLMDDCRLNWGRKPTEGSSLTKYDTMTHAEVNAIDHSCGDLEGSTIYVTAMPCPHCMLDIIRKKISTVVYFPFISKDRFSSINSVNHIKSQELADNARINLRKFDGNLNWIRDQVSGWESLGIFDI